MDSYEGKMGKMQLVVHKTQGMDDYLYNIRGGSSKAPITLPPKFKIFDAENFDRTGNPKQHIRRYPRIAKMKGLDDRQTLHAFLKSFSMFIQRLKDSLCHWVFRGSSHCL